MTMVAERFESSETEKHKKVGTLDVEVRSGPVRLYRFNVEKTRVFTLHSTRCLGVTI